MLRGVRLPLTLVVLGLGSAVASGTALAGGPAIEADFDGDGYADLAIGVPGEELAGAARAGAVNVIYGGVNGLEVAGNQFLSAPDWAMAPGAADRLGAALATGDFDGDGYADLAIGAPGYGKGGGVFVVYGGAAGLVRIGPVLEQGDVKGAAESGDSFGAALAAGDFDGDGRDDLAIGVPGEDIRSAKNAGTVNVTYGAGSGLGNRGDAFHQDRPGIDDSVEAGDRFGAALAAGDFGRGGFADLAIGIPGEDLPGASGAGAAAVVYGSAGVGLTPQNDQLWHQNVPGIEDATEGGDGFGSALAAGDFGGQSLDDLAVGVPGEGIGDVQAAGAVAVLYGDASSGLRAAGSQLFSQDTGDVEDAAEGGDRFGAALAAGNLDGEAHADLAIGVPDESVGTIARAGAVGVLYGSAAGLSSAGDQLWHQDSPAIEDQAETDDRFGAALAIAAFGGPGSPGLAVGIPGEDRLVRDGGAVAVLYGGPGGVGTPGNQLWGQFTLGIENPSEPSDGFGGALARS